MEGTPANPGSVARCPSRFAKAAVDLILKANPMPAENLEEYVTRFVMAFVIDGEDSSRIMEMILYVHMGHVQRGCRQPTSKRMSIDTVAGVLAYVLPRQHQRHCNSGPPEGSETSVREDLRFRGRVVYTYDVIRKCNRIARFVITCNCM